MKISDDMLTGNLSDLADDWEATRRGEKPGQGSDLWWLNQTSYLGEHFGVALIDDLLEARGLPARKPREEATDAVEG